MALNERKSNEGRQTARNSAMNGSGYTTPPPAAAADSKVTAGSSASQAELRPAVESLVFEEALGRLDEVVEVLEEGQISLEEALTLYEEGVLMAERCQHMLDQAELRLQRLVVNNEADSSGGSSNEDEEAFVLESFRLDEDV